MHTSLTYSDGIKPIFMHALLQSNIVHWGTGVNSLSSEVETEDRHVLLACCDLFWLEENRTTLLECEVWVICVEVKYAHASMSICTYCYIKIVILSTISVQGRKDWTIDGFVVPIIFAWSFYPACSSLHFFFSRKVSGQILLAPLCMSPSEVTSGCKSKIFHETNME
jgi:hypothetical protein